MKINVPVVIAALAIAVVVVVLVGGCEQVGANREARTARDDIRAACTAAARGYGLAIQKSAAGDMSPATFAALSDAYAGAHAVCRDVLDNGRPVAPGDLDRINQFSGAVAATE